MDELYKRSPLTKQAIQRRSEFSMGEGWTSQGDKVVNEFGETFNDMLRLAAIDLNKFEGFAFHFNFDGAGRIVEIQNVPFIYVRLGRKNLNGLTDNVKVFNNWEQDSSKFITYAGVQPTEYPIFNPKTAAENALMGGRGQVMYWTPSKFNYPAATFDAIRDTCQTDQEIQQWELKNIQNGFLGTTIFRFPGGFDSPEDEMNAEKKVQEMQGSYNANCAFIAKTPEDFIAPLIETIPAANNDTLFNFTVQQVQNRILQNFGVPGPLLAVNPQGAVFTQEQIRDSYLLMNLVTKNQRKILDRAFEPIAKLFGVRLNGIKEIPWEVPGMNAPKPNGDPNQEMRTDEQQEDERTEDNNE